MGAANASVAPHPRTAAPCLAADRVTPRDQLLDFARKLARERRLDLPAAVERDYGACRRFLDAHAARRRS
jgi:DNA topoisomerase-3